jgi:hypothetical protein
MKKHFNLILSLFYSLGSMTQELELVVNTRIFGIESQKFEGRFDKTANIGTAFRR